MKPLSNFEIERMLSKHCILFGGVFSCDNFDNSLKQSEQFSIICNLSKSNEAGSHFITVLKYEKTLLYIDSLGYPCRNPDILSFLNSQNCELIHSQSRLQDKESVLCGYFCMLFCIDFEKSYTHRKFHSEPHLMKNDNLVLKYLSSILEKK